MDLIAGQTNAIQTLNQTMKNGRMHHAWVFHGPFGVGKFTTAHRLSRVLLCHDRQADSATGVFQACGQCDSCTLYDTSDGVHPDLHVITKERSKDSVIANLRNKKLMNIPVDLLRELMVGGWIGSGDSKKYFEPAIAKSPMLRHGKVFIIDESELLDQTGQNILLKTLEEPTPGTYIFLITSHENKLLPTIRSRCQRVAFHTLDDSAVDNWVAQRLPDTDLPTDAGVLITRFARGSIGRAKLAMEYRLDLWPKTLEPMFNAMASNRPPTDLGQTMVDLVEQFAEDWVKSNANASKDAANKAAIKQMFGLIGQTCRQKLQQQTANIPPGDIDQAESALRPWLYGIDLIQTAEAQLAANVSPALLLENLAVQWVACTR